jgi:hypothetical protein
MAAQGRFVSGEWPMAFFVDYMQWTNELTLGTDVTISLKVTVGTSFRALKERAIFLTHLDS